MKNSLIAFGIVLVLSSCQDEDNSITIAAAADLQYALNDIKVEFVKNHPNTKVEIIYGSSGNLFQQIMNKAPFDIFFSADIIYPNKLDSVGLAATKPELYAIGFLVLWAMKLDTINGLNILLSKDINKIAIANPRHAPYGKRAIEFLRYYDYYDKIKEKLVEGENISQTAQFVLTGNADLGIIALSLAMSPIMQKKGKFILIDEKSHSPLEQAYIIVKGSEKKEEVLKFYDFAGSEQARQIFTKYGFRLPKQ